MRDLALAGGLVVATLATCGEAPEHAPLPPGPSAASRPPPPVRSRVPAPWRHARGKAAAEANARCVECHLEVGDEWRRSRHRLAHRDRAFVEAWEREGRSPFCTGCHAPEAVDPKTPSDAALDLGVGCVTCHQPRLDGPILAAGDGRDAPHPVNRDPDQLAEGCTTCHEFRFPGRHGDGAGDFMQTTVREAAGAPCTDCHMRVEGDHARHDLSPVRDADWLADHLHVDATWAPDGVFELTLRAVNTAHAFPTGDLFRRLRVSVELVDGAESLHRDHRYLARHFVADRARPLGRTLLRDDRITAEPRNLAFFHPRARAARWSVHLERVATVHDGHRPGEADVESAVELHRGVSRR